MCPLPFSPCFLSCVKALHVDAMPSACELKQFNLKLFSFSLLVGKGGERGGGSWGKESHLEPLAPCNSAPAGRAGEDLHGCVCESSSQKGTNSGKLRGRTAPSSTTLCPRQKRLRFLKEVNWSRKPRREEDCPEGGDRGAGGWRGGRPEEGGSSSPWRRCLGGVGGVGDRLLGPVTC